MPEPPLDYEPYEIDCLRQEIKENNQRAADVAAGRGYKRNPKLAAIALD